MSSSSSRETFQLSIHTTAGDLNSSVSVPSTLIPIADIIPLMRSLGGQAHKLAIDRVSPTDATVSCHKGCAACCRMMIPVAPPEAFRLLDVIEKLPSDKQEAVRNRFQDVQLTLRKAGLEPEMQRLAYSEEQVTDEELEPLNRAYYSLRMPCPFLEDEVCSIYEERPSACRELLVTSPPELCQNMTSNPIRPIPPPLRIGSVLSKLWADLFQGPVRLIPLPFALDWAMSRRSWSTKTWTGPELLNRALDAAAQYLQRRST